MPWRYDDHKYSYRTSPPPFYRIAVLGAFSLATQARISLSDEKSNLAESLFSAAGAPVAA
jgi:hypothetical protein